jgi:hypothetical protein
MLKYDTRHGVQHWPMTSCVAAPALSRADQQRQDDKRTMLNGYEAWRRQDRRRLYASQERRIYRLAAQ